MVVVPSDPLAAYVAIEMILRPVVRRMLGLEPVHRPVIRAMLKGTIETSPTARSFIPATVSFDQGAYVVTPTPTIGHPLIATSRSSAFAVVPVGVGHASDGLMVDVVVLERRFA